MDETEELMKNKLVKYEREKNNVRFNFLLSCLVVNRCIVSCVKVNASFYRQSSRIKLSFLSKKGRFGLVSFHQKHCEGKTEVQYSSMQSSVVIVRYSGHHFLPARRTRL